MGLEPSLLQKTAEFLHFVKAVEGVEHDAQTFAALWDSWVQDGAYIHACVLEGAGYFFHCVITGYDYCLYGR
jgi:hypothetical protein